jgi:hypothetical protein
MANKQERICRIALFLIWIIVIIPIDTAYALSITFSPSSDVRVSDNAANISWKTDQATTGKVKYGTSGSSLTQSVESKISSTSHAVHITNLGSSATFYYMIEAKGANEAVADPSDGSAYDFTTDAPYDRTAPGAVSLSAPTITDSSITITWADAQGANDTEAYRVYRDDKSLLNTTSKSYTDSGLNSSTQYTYKVIPVDTSGNVGPATTVKAVTMAEGYTTITVSNFKAEAYGSSIYITWTTNVGSHSRVRYGRNAELLDGKKEVLENVTSHNMTLADLSENTNYTVIAESCDTIGSCGNSTIMTVQTATKQALFLTVDGLDCGATTPKYVNSARLDVKGRSSSGADVEAYINGKRARFKKVTGTGVFEFMGMDLDSSKAANAVKITASDHISAGKVCEKAILLDYYAPQVDFDSATSNLSFSTQNSITIRGNVTDENKVTLYGYLLSSDDTTGPSAPGNVTNTSVSSSAISISWSAPTDSPDIDKYLVYRSDVAAGPIAYTPSSTTKYEDKNVSSGTTYTYRVSALDKAGNEGSKSSAFSITTDSGNTTASTPSAITPPSSALVLNKTYTTSANNTISFTETISGLFNGSNSIKLVFTDEAGNSYEKTLSVTYDGEEPKLISPTSSDFSTYYSPTYMSEFTINGQANKQSGEVWIWVNSNAAEPTTKVSIGANGTFEAEVSLFGTFTGNIAAAVSSGAGSANSSAVTTVSTSGTQYPIKMLVVDAYGRKSQSYEYPVTYTPCGQNYYWKVQMKEGGNIINTRELLDGIAAYGFGFDLTWIGGGDISKAKAQNVRVTKATVGSKDAKKYDFGWISGEPQVTCRKGNCTTGFVLIRFANQNPNGTTYLEKEKSLSNHRKGECFPLAGCIHLLLQMEIDSDQGPMTSQYTAAGTTVPAGMSIGTQKQCVDIRIMLDERVDFASSEFVKSLLTASLKAINATLAFIEIIETPIKYATQVTLGLCLVSFLTKFIVSAMQSYYCKWNSLLGKLGGQGLKGVFSMAKEIKEGMIEKVAAMDNGQAGGACDLEFKATDKSGKPDENGEAANKACKECATWIAKKKWIDDKYHLLCDRVMCPSVPSLQHYILSNWKGGKKSAWTPSASDAAAIATTAASSTRSDFSPNELGGGSRIPTSGSYNCRNDAKVCGPSTSTTSYVCVSGACKSVTKKCTDNAAATSTCICGDRVCVSTQKCVNNECKGTIEGSSWTTGFSVADYSTGASSSQGSGDSPDSGSFSLITGFAASTPAATPATAAKNYGPGATAGQSKPPEYNAVEDYKPGTWKRKDVASAKSDCEFAELGRDPIAQMYKFYSSGDATLKSKCEAGHVPQAACCPFEYMQSWQWGIMFNNEMKQSYCLANPDDKNVCGMGQTVVNGVTGICQPQGSKPRATVVTLDDLRFKKTSKEYPAPTEEMYNRDVAFIVDIDEDGSAKLVKMGYFSKASIKTTGGQIESGDRIEVSGGIYVVPLEEVEATGDSDQSSLFPKRNNGDISKDEEVKKQSIAEFKERLKKSADNLERKSKPGAGDIFAGKIQGDDPAEHWFRQVYNLLGDPGRQYLAQPAGSFVQSLITLCLSGILSWLVQFKNMLLMLQQCFSTILLTGDGSAGQCQAIISQYICDLLKDAISCIINRFGGGGSARIGVGGIGGFFSSIYDAQKSVSAEAQSRYGDNNLISTTFSAENVMHDACIFMFTGEWPTDWASVFESAAYLPINSTVSVFPATRRWQAYDANTGYARYVYKIAYSVFAGSDIQYTLKLSCSGPNKYCTDANGNQALCDCSQDTTGTGLARYQTLGRPITLGLKTHGSGNCPENGMLKRGQFCSDEVLVVVENAQGPLRYDQAVIEYYSTQPSGPSGYGGATPKAYTGAGIGATPSGTGMGGNMAAAGALAGSSYATIREIGGPPFGLCNFDVTTLSFKCGISVPSTGAVSFISSDLTRGSNQYYGIGDQSIAKVIVSQQIPGETASCSSDCNFTKYIVIKEIKTQSGAVVYPPSGKSLVGERLNQNKMYTFDLFNPGDFPQHTKAFGEFKIAASNFGTQAGGICTAQSVAGSSSIPGIVLTGSPSIDCTGVQSATNFKINISFNPEDGKFSYEVAERDANGNYAFKGSLTECTSISTNSFSCYGLKFTVLQDYITYKGKVTTKGGEASKAEIKGKPNLGYFYTPPAASTTTSASSCTSTPEKWTMTLELRDAVFDGSTYQMSNAAGVDADTNKKLEQKIDFYVICTQSTSSSSSSGSIKDLTTKTVAVTSANDQYNKTYGMWADDGTLGPSEAIRVTDFAWVDSSTPTNGFSISIDASASNGVLNIDLSALGLTPSSNMQIVKTTISGTSTTLSSCGTSPCISSYGDSSSKAVKLKLSEGDPKFTFTGFTKATGLDTITGDIELTKSNPSYGSGLIKLHKPMPSSSLKVAISDYKKTSDGFSLQYVTSPSTLNKPATFGIDLTKAGYESPNSVSVSGMYNCESGTSFTDTEAESEVITGSAITGLATGELSTGFIYTDASTKSYAVTLNSKYVWVSSGNTIAANSIIYDTKYSAWHATGSNGKIIECNCPSYEEANKLKGGASSSCTQRTQCSKADSGDSCKKYCSSSASSTKASTASSTASSSLGFNIPASIPSGKSDCYIITGNVDENNKAYTVLAILTLGASSKKTFSIGGLTASAASAGTSLKEASGDITLTASSPKNYGVSVATLDNNAELKISGVSLSTDKEISMNIALSGQSTPVDVTVEVHNLGYIANLDSQIYTPGVSGVVDYCFNAAPPCWQSFYSISGSGDRVVFRLPAAFSGSIRITDLLKSTANSALCTGKAANDVCGSDKFGTCYVPPISNLKTGNIGMECYSECRKNYVKSHTSEIESKGVLPDEAMFCIDETKHSCKSETSSTGCGPGKVCCSDGNIERISKKATPAASSKKKTGSTTTSGAKGAKCSDIKCSELTNMNCLGGEGVACCSLLYSDKEGVYKCIEKTSNGCSSVPCTSLSESACKGSSATGCCKWLGSSCVALTDSKLSSLTCGSFDCTYQRGQYMDTNVNNVMCVQEPYKHCCIYDVNNGCIKRSKCGGAYDVSSCESNYLCRFDSAKEICVERTSSELASISCSSFSCSSATSSSSCTAEPFKHCCKYLNGKCGTIKAYCSATYEGASNEIPCNKDPLCGWDTGNSECKNRYTGY